MFEGEYRFFPTIRVTKCLGHAPYLERAQIPEDGCGRCRVLTFSKRAQTWKSEQSAEAAIQAFSQSLVSPGLGLSPLRTLLRPLTRLGGRRALRGASSEQRWPPGQGEALLQSHVDAEGARLNTQPTWRGRGAKARLCCVTLGKSVNLSRPLFLHPAGWEIILSSSLSGL